MALTIARTIELAFLFGFLPLALTRAPSWAVLPGISGGACLCLVLLLADASFDRHVLAATSSAADWKIVTMRAAAGLAIFAATIALLNRRQLFVLVRKQPRWWALGMVLYPLLSAYPQELIYRVFFFHRYAGLLPLRWLVLASAVAFGWAHVIMRNRFAVLLSTLGGLLFSATYLRSGSLLLVAFEHGLWGNIIFTVGLGVFFLAGARPRW